MKPVCEMNEKFVSTEEQPAKTIAYKTSILSLGYFGQMKLLSIILGLFTVKNRLLAVVTKS